MAHATATLVDPVLFEQAASGDAAIMYSASDVRHLIAAMFPEAGIIRSGHFAISQRTPEGANWSIDIAAGLAVVTGSSTFERYFVYSGAKVNVPVTGLNTAPAATRTHKVFLAVYDKNYTGTGYGAKIFVAEDTGSGAPNPTDSPVGYVQLGTFTISPAQASIQTGHITNAPAQTGTGAQAAGTRSVSVAGGAASTGPYNVAFPAGRFTTPPKVVVTQSSIPAGSGKLIPKTASITVNGFDVYFYTGDATVIPATGFNVDWVAIAV